MGCWRAQVGNWGTGKREGEGNVGSGGSYCYAGGYQVTLVEDKDQMLVWCFLLDVFFNTVAPSTQGISSIEDMYYDVGRVDDLQQSVSSPFADLDAEENIPCITRSKFASTVPWRR